ncbi:MAG: methylmalonyl-CoA mutase small subunit [Chlorobi bacterium]|nr:methylmalonyl-CoA mutase small subunit [Chlorobiota bacterium]
MEEEQLFQEFPPVTTEEWKKKIIADLKGADYRKKLVWRTPEGFEVEPFYRREDLERLPHPDTFPGKFPFTRGKQVKGNTWLVRQDIYVADFGAANRKAHDLLDKGVDSIGFRFHPDYVPRPGDIEKLLKEIDGNCIELNFSTHYPVEMISALEQVARKYQWQLDKLKGSFDFDPFGHFSRYGRFYQSKEKDFDTLKQLMEKLSTFPYFHLITVDATLFANAGAGIVSQLGFALSKGAEYLTFLTGEGMDATQAASHIRFQFAVGSGYFMEIARFRAARHLWAHIVNAYGVKESNNPAMFIHCVNSRWNKTLYDPYVNMLRTTTETMSSLIAGVDSMEVLPFDEIFEKPAEFAERIARNQQLILKYESYFDKVSDPAAGSYYIEELTDKLIREAWKLFLETDEKGGYLKAFEQEFIQNRVKDEAKQKSLDIARRKRVLLGINQYPNITEHLENIDFSVFEEEKETGNVKTIKPVRGAVPFELLRLKTDLYAQKNPRPVVWMLTYGNMAMRNARSQFAANFFGCAGFEIVNNPGFETVEEGIEAAQKANPDIVVICSSDEEYGETVLPAFHALKDKMIVVLAGYPEGLVDRLKQEGMEHFIHVRSNLLEELKKYQQLLGIK